MRADWCFARWLARREPGYGRAMEETRAMFPVCAERNVRQAYARFFVPSSRGWRAWVAILAGFLRQR